MGFLKYKFVLVGVSSGVILVLCLGLMYANANDFLCIENKGSLEDELAIGEVEFSNLVAQISAETLSSLAGMYDYDTGFFTYNTHPVGNKSTNDNAIRQFLASRVMAIESIKNDDFYAIHEQNLQAIFDSWYQEDEGRGYVLAFDKSKLGANALLLRTLVASPFFTEYDDEAKKLADGIVYLMNNDGSFNPWYMEPAYGYDADYLLTFYSGEAILALLEYAEKADDQSIFNKAKLSQDYYLKKYVDDIDENYYPAYVPWHTLSLTLLYEKTKDQKYADAVFVLNDKLLEMQDKTDFIGRFYNPETPEYGSPHASSDAVYTESLVSAYNLSRKIGDSAREKRFKDAIVIAVHNLERLQYKSHNWNIFESSDVKKKLNGAIKSNVCSGWMRVDTTAHAIDALRDL